VLAFDAWVPLGVVARPHGVRGELRVHAFNRDSHLLLVLDEVLVRFANGDEQECSVDGSRPTTGAVLVKLFSVDSRERAEELRGAHICARRSAFPPIAEGEFYVCDIEGARVVVDDGAHATLDVGLVKEVRSYPTMSTIVVSAADGGAAWEIPLVDSIVRSVDVAANLVTLATMQDVERA